MKTVSIITAAAVVGGLMVQLLRKRSRGPSMARLAAAAVKRGDFQFLALIHEDGTKTLPEVPGIPAWYFETTGVNFLNVRPETEAPKLAERMKTYNNALYRALKDQGKFHLIEENIARIKANLG